MTRTRRRLFLALAFSLLLHALAVAPPLPPAAPAAKAAPPLVAYLRPPPPVPEQPPLRLPAPPEPVKTRPRPPAPAKPAAARAAPARADWTAEVKRQLQSLDRRGLFYPEAAIARGLEGEAVVLLILDEAGNVAAARIEASSGHAILDEAALGAARSLKSLPAAAPRETRLPVRFRLR